MHGDVPYVTYTSLCRDVPPLATVCLFSHLFCNFQWVVVCGGVAWSIWDLCLKSFKTTVTLFLGKILKIVLIEININL